MTKNNWKFGVLIGVLLLIAFANWAPTLKLNLSVDQRSAVGVQQAPRGGAVPQQSLPIIDPLIAEPSLPLDQPGEPKNTGPMIDADPKAPRGLSANLDKPVRNAGAFVDAGGPPDANANKAMDNSSGPAQPVRNSGDFVDAGIPGGKHAKPVIQQPHSELPIQNAGAFVDAGVPSGMGLANSENK